MNVSSNTQILVLTEEFLSQNAKIILEEKDYLAYTLKPDLIKDLLMNCPQFLNNIDNAVEYLIRSNENSSQSFFSNSSLSNFNLSYDILQKKLSKFHFLAKNRIIRADDLIKSDENSFSVKKIESVRINDAPAYKSDLLIFTYSILMMISRIKSDKKEKEIDYSQEELTQLINFFKSYSIQSNFTPINTNFVKQINENMNSNLSLFAGIPSGTANVLKRGIVSNGNFVFVLRSDFYLSIFPISIENGGFLSPIIRKLNINSTFESASLSLTANHLILTFPQFTYLFEISSLVNSPQMVNSDVKPTEKHQNAKYSFIVTDGFVNVIVKQANDKMIAKIQSIDSQTTINKVFLHKNANEELYTTYPFEDCNNMFAWPVETNGIVLSFYIKLDQNHILCRQFSLIDGSHIKDEIIESSINISSITYDSINQMHYAAIDNNGQVIVYGLSGSSDCSVNPALFDFCFPDFDFGNPKPKKILFFQISPKDDLFKSEKEFAYILNAIFMSSIFYKKDIGTFITEERENIIAILIFIVEIAKSLNNDDIEKNKDKDSIYIIKLAILQIFAVLSVINIRHHFLLLSDNEDDTYFRANAQKHILDMMSNLASIKKPYSMRIISFMLLNLFDLINITGDYVECPKYQAILEGLLVSCSSTMLKYIIHVLFMNSLKFSFLSFTDSSCIFPKYIIDNCQLSNVHQNIISFLLAHQRCIVNQLYLSLKTELFSAFSLIVNIKYNDFKTDNEALNNFGEYTNFLVNQLTSAIAYSSSFDDFIGTTVYFLFKNYLSLISGLFIYHEVAQIVTPLLHVIQDTFKLFFQKNNIIISDNHEAKNILINIALAFGAFTGTLIKGGNYSSFDEKYKWLIRPNMNLIAHPDVLSEVDNPTTNVESFIDENVRLFLSPSSDKSINGKYILQNIYKLNVAMNKNLKSPLLELDQLFLAVELYHLHLFDKLKSGDITSLRPAIQQMMRVRNAARSILRSSDSEREVQIIGYSNEIDTKKNKKSDLDEMNTYYSPFDLIVVKCKMLLRLTSKFDNSNISKAPKLLADFVLSSEQPSAFINYISNQQNRLQLTNIGFQLIHASYSLNINELFLHVVDATLSIAVDNFDGLSAIIQYDQLHKSETYISNFLSRAFKSIEYPYLSLITYKLIKSEVLSKETIGKSIEPFLSDSIKDNKLFVFYYNRYSYITDIFKECNLFLDSKSGKKIPLLHLSVDDFANLTSDQWYIISNACSKQTIDSSLCTKILSFFLNSSFNVQLDNLKNLRYISSCIYSFIENHDDSYTVENIRNDFMLLLKSLGKLLTTNEDLEKAGEIVMLFRKFLNRGQNDFSNIIFEVFKSFEIEKMSSYKQDEYDEIICAIFAILGGFIDVIQKYYPISMRMNREQIQHGILLDSNKALIYPINEETKKFDISNIKIYAEPLIPFNCSMFSDYKFIISFLNYATKDLSKHITLIYLKSLSFYLKEEEFINVLSNENANYLIQKFSPLMNPFDTIKDTQNIITLLSSMNKTECMKGCNFSIISSKSLNCTTYLSPILKHSQVNVFIEANQIFDGYYGVVADCPLNKQFPYAIIHSKLGTVYPGSLGLKRPKIQGVKNNSIHFMVDIRGHYLITSAEKPIDRIRIDFPVKKNDDIKYRIFICVFHPCQVKSIKVNSLESQQTNTMQQFDMNYNPSYQTMNEPSKINNLYEFSNNLKQLDDEKAKSLLINGETILSYIKVTDNERPLYEMIEIKDVLFRFDQADTISEDYKNYIFKYIYSKLITQMSTLIMMELVNNGFGNLLYIHRPLYIIKLFSYLQIPLESYNREKLCNGEFPFEFNKSILDEKNSIVCNQQFDNLEFEMKNCLRNILKINQDKKLNNDFKSYIENLLNTSSIHTLRSYQSNILYFDLVYFQSQFILNLPKTVESMIVSSPYLNDTIINHIVKCTNSNKSTIPFPFIFDPIKNNGNSSITFDISQFKNDEKSINALMISKFDNNWVFGTAFELLLLLKEYYFISKDHYFFRNVLIDLIFIDSPFVSMFTSKILIQRGQDCFLPYSKYQTDYIKKLLLLFTMTEKSKTKYDQNLMTFINHEKHVLVFPFIGELSPFFPEFCGQSFNTEIDQDAKFEIKLENLDIVDPIKDPLKEFMLFSEMICQHDSIQKYYLDIINIWLSISIFYLHIDNIDDGIIELKNDSKNNCQFYPAKIHDTFIKEMEIFKTEWTNEKVSDFVAIIPPALIDQNEFQPLCSFVLSTNFENKLLTPPRVLLLITLIIHRINHLHMNYEKNIPTTSWKSVIFLFLLSRISKLFLKDISNINGNPFKLTLDRFESHLISIEGAGKQSNTIIAKVSKILANNPACFRQPVNMPWIVKFINEEASDCGGPGRELFVEIASSIIDPISGLFILSPNGRNKCGSSNRDVYIPFHSTRLKSNKNLIEMKRNERLICYQAIGVFLGIVIRTGYCQDLPFAPFVWDAIAGKPIDEEALFSVDEQFKKFITNVRKARNDIDLYNSLSSTFVWECENWDGTICEVKNPTNSKIVLQSQIDIFVSNCIRKRIDDLMENINFIRNCFYDNIGIYSHPLMTGQLLSFLARGTNKITTDELKKITYSGDVEFSLMNIFWESVEMMDYKQRSLLLKFITGLTRIPKNDKKFTIVVNQMAGVDKLPEASTCFNRLNLPMYSSKETAFKMITLAIELCSTMEKR